MTVIWLETSNHVKLFMNSAYTLQTINFDGLKLQNSWRYFNVHRDDP